MKDIAKFYQHVEQLHVPMLYSRPGNGVIMLYMQ